jgi:peptidoglycan/LPS O-acetylase OafA/YrhL
MKPNQALIALLLLIALIGGVSAYHELKLSQEPASWFVLSRVMAGSLVFLWYFLDSNERHYVRSKWLNIGVVAIALIAIPYYLFRSRPPGKRLSAFMRCIAYVVLLRVFGLAGSLLIFAMN